MTNEQLIMQFGEGTEAKKVDLEAGKATMAELLSDYGIPGTVEDAVQGYGVVRYMVKPGRKFYFRGLDGIRAELELGMGMANDSCSITRDAGCVLVDFSLPRQDRGSVGSRQMMFGNFSGCLGHGMGVDVLGNVVGMDLAKAPHLLVAGTTGSGKSVYLNSLICGLAMSHDTDLLRFMLVDPKGGVEFGAYDRMPHLLHPVITDVDTAIGGLEWCVGEMERRYATLRPLRVRNIEEYNKIVLSGDCDYRMPMPYIVVVMDEFADLMAENGNMLVAYVKRLAAKSRAVGIHLVLATQTPRKEVVTGELKANLPTRVCFRVAGQTDSRVMLDHNGAENLGGLGDMIYRSADGVERRLQGCYLSDAERATAVRSIAPVYGTSTPMTHWDNGWQPSYYSHKVARAVISRQGPEEARKRGVPVIELM